MSAYTTKYRLTKPTVGGDADAWGGLLNSDMDSLDTLLGVIATGGSANAYTLTTGQSLTAYADGQTFNVRASFANTGGATMNIDAIGAKNLRKVVSGTLTALASGDIASGDYMRVSYNLASDVIVVHGGSSTLDATLVAMAAGTTGADVLWYWSGTDTLSTTTLTAAGRALLDDAAASNQRTTLGLGDAALATIGTSGDTVPKNNTANTFSADQIISSTGTLPLRLQSSDAGAAMGPYLLTERLSPSPAANDILGGIVVRGRDSGGFAADYAKMYGWISDPTDGSEDGVLSLTAIVAGVNVEHMRLIGGQVLTPSGSAASPFVAPLGDSNSGLFSVGADQLGVATGGALRWYFDNDGSLINNSGVLKGALGSNSAPGYAFAGDPDSGWYRIGADNLGIAAGGAKVVDIATTGVEVTGTLRGRLPTSSETGGTLSAASANKVVVLATAPTIPASVFTAGDVVALYNDTAAAMTITQGASLTQRLSGTATTGNLTLAARGSASVYFKSATECVVSGSVS